MSYVPIFQSCYYLVQTSRHTQTYYALQFHLFQLIAILSKPVHVEAIEHVAILPGRLAPHLVDRKHL